MYPDAIAGVARAEVGDDVKDAEQQQHRDDGEGADLGLPSHTGLVLFLGGKGLAAHHIGIGPTSEPAKNC